MIPHGKVVERPRENVLFIVIMWCPEGDYEQHEQTMEDILGSVQLVE